MAAGYAEKPGLLRSALKHLFSARKSDWDRFDGLFDAFWLGKRVRTRSITKGSAKAASNPSLKNLQDSKSQPPAGGAATDQIPTSDEAGDRIAAAKDAGKALRAPRTSPKVDFRKMTDPEQVEQAHEVAARLGQRSCARG